MLKRPRQAKTWKARYALSVSHAWQRQTIILFDNIENSVQFAKAVRLHFLSKHPVTIKYLSPKPDVLARLDFLLQLFARPRPHELLAAFVYDLFELCYIVLLRGAGTTDAVALDI